MNTGRTVFSQIMDFLPLRCDQTIVLTGFYASKDYPKKLRRVCYEDKETEQSLVFLTNCFTLPANPTAPADRIVPS